MHKQQTSASSSSSMGDVSGAAAKRRGKSAPSNGEHKSAESQQLGEFAHQYVDRFAVLLDLWTNEVHFLEMKKTVIDC